MTIDMQLQPGATMPTRAKTDDVGYDLTAIADAYSEDGIAIVRTGVHLAMPPGIMGRILGRSSLAAKGIDVLGGVIDPGYRGEIKVVLSRKYAFHVRAGERIAQLVFIPVLTPELRHVASLDTTERGQDGFGSSGK